MSSLSIPLAIPTILFFLTPTGVVQASGPSHAEILEQITQTRSLSALDALEKQLQDQGATLEGQDLDFSPPSREGVFSKQQLLLKLDETVPVSKSPISDKLRSHLRLLRDLEASASPVIQQRIEQIRKETEPEPPRLSKERNWRFEVGHASSLRVLTSARAHLKTDPVVDETQMGLSGRVDAQFLGNEEVPVARAFADLGLSRGVSSFAASLEVAGKTIADWDGVEKPFKSKLDYEQFYEYPFMAGPVPLVARIGYQGEIGVRGKVKLDGSTASSEFAPYAKLGAVLGVAAGLRVLSIGVECDMTLLDQALPTKVEAGLQRHQNGHRYPFGTLKGESRTTALAGKISLAAIIDMWLFDLPFRVTLFQWPGFQARGSMFDYAVRYDPKRGLLARGHLDQADLDQIEAVAEKLELNRHAEEVERKLRTELDQARKLLMDPSFQSMLRAVVREGSTATDVVKQVRETNEKTLAVLAQIAGRS